MQNLKEKIYKINSLLSNEQKTKDIVELENNTKNTKVIEYLESIGKQEFRYKTNAELQFGKIQEKGGITDLWYKKSDGVWIIKLWEISRIKK